MLKLSLPALETLAVIAYKQPVTAPEVNEIRGVESGGVLGSLLSRKLISTAGRKQVIGRPILYKTTKEFLLRFGLKDLAELPSMEEFEKIAAIELTETEAEEAANENAGGPAVPGAPEFEENAAEDDTPDQTPAADAAEPALEAMHAGPEPAETRLQPMTDEPERELEPEAEGPEQDITSEAPEIVREEAASATPADDSDDDGTEAEIEEAGPAPKLERLQKILAQAGIASRRHAEELITGGHVQVNGQTVTVLGTKADADRDHIRVDGKLLRGAERLRYFMLNKPKGHVTTVSDPEGRPTVMEFFSKMSERLYPVGRLDYLSEGLLLVTNDGELANGLTKASAGVEKTYLVKVAGQPEEEALDRLRGALPSSAARWARARCAPLRPVFVRSAWARTHGSKSCSSKGATGNCARCLRRSATTSKRFAAWAMARWFSISSPAKCASWTPMRWKRCASPPRVSSSPSA